MIIGLVGNKNVGKDTFADYLVENKGFIKYAFADPLKKGLKELFGLTDEQIYGDKKEEIDPEWETTPREILQFMGTDVMQFKLQELLPNLKRTFFIKRFNQFMKQNAGKNVVISDARFQHEINAVLEHQGIIVKINRNDSSKTFLTHISESGIDSLDKITYTYENNDTLEKMYKFIDTILEYQSFEIGT